MKNKLRILSLSVLGFSSISSAIATDFINVYSYRQPELIQPIIDQFTKETGIKVNVIFDKKGLVERIKREGTLTPADVLLTVDISRVIELVDSGLAQPIKSSTLNKNIPAHLRDSKGYWYAMTTRARAIYSSRDRVGKLDESFDYTNLSKPEYKGKVCVRSGKHPYNVALVSAIIAHDGVSKAREFLIGLKSNLAQKPQGGDRDQVKAIMEGKCDYSLGNSYYYGKMLDDKNQKAWADSVYINFPTLSGHGTSINISGVAIAKNAPHKASAIKFIEYLSGKNAQHLYATLNHEYPVNPLVKPSSLVDGWGSFKADKLSLEDLNKHYKEALKLIDEVKFDL